MFGCVKDFQPIVDELVRQDQKEPYDWDAYAKVFFPKAEELAKEADAALEEGNREKASELYLYGLISITYDILLTNKQPSICSLPNLTFPSSSIRQPTLRLAGRQKGSSQRPRAARAPDQRSCHSA